MVNVDTAYLAVLVVGFLCCKSVALVHVSCCGYFENDTSGVERVQTAIPKNVIGQVFELRY